MAPRAPTISDDQILKAARAVFLEQGMGATTSEVAKRAGVAEGSIFNRFETKFDLFRAAMMFEEPAWKTTLPGRVGQGEVRTQLYEFGVEFLSFLRRVLPLMVMQWSNRQACPFGDCDQGGPLHSLGLVADFFAAEVNAGRLRPHDPRVLAHAFLGAMHSYVFFEMLREQTAGRVDREGVLPAEQYVRGVVDLLMSGIDPTPRDADGDL